MSMPLRFTLLLLLLGCAALAQQREANDSYPLLTVEGGKGCGFLMIYMKWAVAVMNSDELDSEKPARLTQKGDQPLILSPRIFERETPTPVRLHIVRNPEAAGPSLTYEPDFTLKVNEPLVVAGATGQLSRAHLHPEHPGYSAAKEGPKVLSAVLEQPMLSKGAAGAPVVEQATGRVVGVFAAFVPRGREPVITFHALALPVLRPEEVRHRINLESAVRHKAIIGDWIRDWEAAERLYRAQEGEAFQHSRWEAFKRSDADGKTGVDIVLSATLVAYQLNGKTVVEYPLAGSLFAEGKYEMKLQHFILGERPLIYSLTPEGLLVEHMQSDPNRLVPGKVWRRRMP